jgi:hypothetical protein
VYDRQEILLFMFKKMTYEGGSVTAHEPDMPFLARLPGSGGPCITAKVQAWMRNSRLSEP